MTKEEYLSGEETYIQRRNREEWEDYHVSKEGIDELYALMELEVYDGPTGEA